MRIKLLTTAFLCLLALLHSSHSLHAKEAKTAIPPVITENKIGLKYMVRPEHPLIFNGDFNLGKSGYALRSSYTLEYGYRNDLPDLQVVPRYTGGKCLMVPSCPGRINWILLAREVHLPKGAKVELSFEAKYEDTPGCTKVKSLYIDLRRVKYTKKNAYWIRNGSIRPKQEWTKFKREFTIEDEDFFRCFISANAEERGKPLPKVYIDSLKLKVLDGGGKWAEPQPQVAIYTDSDIPAYEKGQQVQYEIRADFPGEEQSVIPIEIDVVNDQTFKVISTHNIELNRQDDNTYSGAYNFEPKEFGSFSARVRRGETLVDGFGGDFAVVHPAIDHPRGNIGQRIGANLQGGGRMFGINPKIYAVTRVSTGTIERRYQVLRTAGVRVGRSWLFQWGPLQTEQNRFSFAHLDPQIEMNRKFGIETVPVLGCGLGHSRWKNNTHFPEWLKPLCTAHKISREHPHEGYIPPAEFWERYCRAVMERYGDDIKIWELLNEPNAYVNGEEYMQLLKISHKVAKSISPDMKIIGPCPTGDGASARFVDWSKEVLDLGAEKYMEGFSYHPYGSGNDFQHGNYFEQSNQIKAIRSWLKNKSTTLYNTECYQLSNEKFMRCDRWDASTGLRHYLITLGNDVGFCASFENYEFFKDRLNPHIRYITPWLYECVPAPVSVALNNLSWQLKGMSKAAPLTVQKLLRTYIFSDPEEKNAVVALWDLRPGGSAWSSTASAAGLKFTDMWGNSLQKKDIQHVGLNPIYISGNPEKIRHYLKVSTFKIPEPVKLTIRTFENDLYVEAKNMSGTKFTPQIAFNKNPNLKTPERIQFLFDGNEQYNTIRLPDAIAGEFSDRIPFQVFLEGEEVAKSIAAVTEENACHNLPNAEGEALQLSMNKGGKVALAAKKNGLAVTVQIEDKNIVSPKKFNPWTGDAVEIFVDCAPFTHLEMKDIRSGGMRMPVWQYVIAAKANADEKPIWTTSKNSKATSETKITDTGYTVSALIPWAEIAPGNNRYGIYGINIEVDHVDKENTKPVKESLSIKNDASCRKRLHYPLFKLPEGMNVGGDVNALGIDKVKNGSFEAISKHGQAEGWERTYDQQVFLCGDFGYHYSRGVEVYMETPIPRGRGWHQRVACDWNKASAFILQGMIKAEKVASDSIANSGVMFSVHFYDEKNKKHLANQGIPSSEKPLKGTFDWRLFQVLIPVSKNATWFQVNCGLCGNTTGTVRFDNIRVIPVE